MNDSLMRKSIPLGALIGGSFSGLIGAVFGALTGSLNGILAGLVVGLVLGVSIGALTAALTVKTAGTTGGIGVGYFTGMLFGGLFGVILGVLIPASLWTSLLTDALPVLDMLMVSRFESVMHISFLFSILAAIVGVWVGGKNQVLTDLQGNQYDRIDQYDLVEVIRVPEEYQGVIEIGDVGVVVEIDDNQTFEIECLRPDGSYKWLETLHSRYIKLKQKIPDNI